MRKGGNPKAPSLSDDADSNPTTEPSTRKQYHVREGGLPIYDTL